MSKSKVNLPSFFALFVIVACIILCYVMFFTVFGHPENFVDNNPENHPKPGNWLGIIFKGGIVVPMLMSFFLMVVVFSIERAITITKASGTTSIPNFTQSLRKYMSLNDVSGALDLCDTQRGTIGNVVRSVLEKFDSIKKDTNLNFEQKQSLLQKEHEEATSLEMPMLEKNLTILATLASIATLVGLLGTVIGMIKAFAALATAGSPDAVALANGISEALINTALGIGSSTLAIISYNFFTSKIDDITYALDEISYSLSKSLSTGDSKKEGQKAVLN
ncbi:MAG: MotA/TolQ/ExbB proton channel family protein [Cytophagaceae bacterium]